MSLAGIADGEEQLPPEGNSEHVHLDSHSAEVSQAKRQPVVFSNKNHVEQLSLREKKNVSAFGSAVHSKESRTHSEE